VNTFNRKLRESLRMSGKSTVNYGYIGKIPAIRLITANGEPEKPDIDLFFEHFISEAGEPERKFQGTESKLNQRS